MGRGGSIVVLVATLALGACARVVHEQYYPPGSWGSTGDQALRVRVSGQASECTLAQLAHSQAISGAVDSIVAQRLRQEAVTQGAALVTDLPAARSAGQDLEMAVADLRAQGTGATSEADVLRVLNIVGAGLGAPAPFQTVAEAEAFLAQAAAR